jgi:tyrosinase
MTDLGLPSIMGLGEMSNVPVASFDPVFWYHHSYVDYLYAEW